jgi:tRNA nucleotidyltransferase (CCA-adding enzyme)
MFPEPIKTYVVGGALRDELLGLPVRDRDHVVVGATPELMFELGYQPVGKDFPVFLHPTTREEYALARTERKTARGYKGFQVFSAPEVTLEEDLRRRDLTVNAMARAEDGTLIDPHHGAQDIAARIFRHVSPAFAEDPVRILRVARFAARFPEFSVASETNALMTRMVSEGEVDALVPERVWQEIARGLMETRPARMFAVLRACGALARLIPELDQLFGIPQPPQYHPEVDTGIHIMQAIDWAAQQGYSLPVRWAALLHDLGKGLTPPEFWPRHHGHEGRGVTLARAVSERLKVPAECRDLALMVTRDHGIVHRAEELRPTTLLELLERCDALRRPERFNECLQACAADYLSRPAYASRDYPQPERLRRALAAARAVDAGLIAQTAPPARIAERIRAARVQAIAQALTA